ncbi:hypothetical protein [Methanopyrus kandleri]
MLSVALLDVAWRAEESGFGTSAVLPLLSAVLLILGAVSAWRSDGEWWDQAMTGLAVYGGGC